MPRIVFLIAGFLPCILIGCSSFDYAGNAVAPVVEQRLAAQKTLAADVLTEKATQQGDPAATLELARRYALGDGVEQNGDVALRLYRVVTEVNDSYAVIAQTRIGRLYLEDVPPLKQDLIEAFLWFDRVINDHGKYVTVDNEPVLRYHNFARLNMTDAERVELGKRLQQRASNSR